MKDCKLDKEEQELLDAIEESDFKPVPNIKKEIDASCKLLYERKTSTKGATD